MIQKQNGFSVIESLIAAALLGIVAFMAASIMTSQTGSIRYLAQKGDTIDIKLQLNEVMGNPENCACQLDPTLTADDSNDANLIVNPSIVDGSQSLNVRRIRIGCGATSPILAEENQVLSPDLSIGRVEFANLRPTGNPNEWTGTWRVNFTSAAQRISVLPAEFPQTVTILPGPPASARVSGCKGPVAAGTLSACPSLEMVMIGAPNMIGTYCIDRNRRSPLTFLAAKNFCATGTTSGVKFLCDHNQWFTACSAPFSAFADGTGAAEMVADFDGAQYAVTAGLGPGGDGPGCRAVGWVDYLSGASRPFRCCVK